MHYFGPSIATCPLAVNNNKMPPIFLFRHSPIPFAPPSYRRDACPYRQCRPACLFVAFSFPWLGQTSRFTETVGLIHSPFIFFHVLCRVVISPHCVKYPSGPLRFHKRQKKHVSDDKGSPLVARPSPRREFRGGNRGFVAGIRDPRDREEEKLITSMKQKNPKTPLMREMR